MEIKEFDYDQKKRVLEKINKIKNKNDLVEIFKIITKNNTDNYSHNSNGIFMVFDKLDNIIYHELDKYMANIAINNKNEQNIAIKQEYVPYAKDEIAEQMGSKHKFSNKERALIKRNAYEGLINSDKISDVVYTDFMTEESPKYEKK